MIILNDKDKSSTMANLCCTINPKHTCRNCNEKICDDCTGISIPEKYQWCIKCTKLGEDFISIITYQSNFIEDVEESACGLLDSLDSISAHPSRCRACWDNEYCEDLQALISDSGSASQSYQRTIKKLSRGW